MRRFFLNEAQKIRNAAENYKKNADFFCWVKIWKIKNVV